MVNAPAKQKKLTLCTFIDAFGWELVQRHSFLDDVLTTKVPLGTVLGYSSTCVPTILTGRMPREHGHLSFFYYNPSASPFRICRVLDLLPRSITRRGRVRRLMSKVIKRYYGYTGYFQIYNMPFRFLPLFDYSEKRDIYERGGINGGVPTIFDYVRDRHIPLHVSNWRESEEQNLMALEKTLAEGQIRFAYLYLAAMDATLHAYGNHSPLIDEKIQWYDQQLRRIMALAQKHYDDVHLFVFSDHGQADVREEVNLMEKIHRLGLKFGHDYSAVYDSTMARFWFLKQGTREKITPILEAEPRGRILTDVELANYGCDFPARKYGELFFLMEPGTIINPSFMGETRIAGMHGYDPDHKDSLAMLASNIRPNPLPRRLDDLFAMMAADVTQ